MGRAFHHGSLAVVEFRPACPADTVVAVRRGAGSCRLSRAVGAP